MRKIPTLYVRDEATNRKYVKAEVTPGCEWVLAGEGVATRKYDGTCFMFDGQWWARREVKPGKTPPDGFVEVELDETTGKTVGWEPAEQSSFWKFVEDAGAVSLEWEPATYELVGSKINGNPERLDGHILVAHGSYRFTETDPPRTFAALRTLFTDPDSDFPARFEGIVWHHPDGRMAKIKRRDFRVAT